MQTTTPTIATWLRDDIQSLAYPGIGAGSRGNRMTPYWRTASVFFASSRKANPGVRHVLYTNTQPPAVGGVDLSAFLDELEIERLDLPFTRRSIGTSEVYDGQFYVFDVLAHLAETSGMSPFVLLDVDCLFLRSCEPIFATIEADGMATYVVEELAADRGYVNNGLSMHDVQRISEELAGHGMHAIAPCGGELVGATSTKAKELTSALDWAMSHSLERKSRGEDGFITEEQVLSFACGLRNFPAGNANGMIRRVHTQRAYHSAERADLDRIVLHLPAEKKYGFSSLFDDVTDRSSPFWRYPLGTEYVHYLGRHMGVPRPSLRKRLSDGRTALVNRRWRTGG